MAQHTYSHHKVAFALLIIRLSIAAFFVAWTSLKFLRPEWFENIFHKFYGLEFITQNLASIFGAAQMLVVIAFALGLWRVVSYGIVLVMHAVGTFASLPNLMDYTTHPNQLMWAAVPVLGALVALFLLREEDLLSLDGLREARRV